jgi:molybdopterin-guanine dinucleotide biosynthesis protein
MQSLRHVLWIGGPSGSGKTTIAKRITRRRGLRWYNADAHTWKHRDRALRDGHREAMRWEAMTADERWVRSTPREMLELCLDFERGPMIVDDLRRLPTSPLILAEGTTVLPQLVARGVAERSRAVWLVPTPELQRARLEDLAAPAGVSDPDRAQENITQRYLLVAAEIDRQARECGVSALPVDGSRTVDEMVAAVEDLFAEALAAGPRADTAAERRALLRYANATIVSQHLAYFARPWTTGDAETTVRDFACECGDPECDEVVELAVTSFPRSGDADGEPVLAPGHG